MNKRKLIRKLAMPTTIIALVSLVVLIALIPINDSQYANHKEEVQELHRYIHG